MNRCCTQKLIMADSVQFLTFYGVGQICDSDSENKELV